MDTIQQKRYDMSDGHHDLFYTIWAMSLGLTLFYTFFFQYGVKSINNAMILLCAVDILFAFSYILFQKKGKVEITQYALFILFVLYAYLMGVLFLSDGQYGSDLGLRMIEYVLMAYSLYLLINSDENKLNVFLWIICISITLLALKVLMSGIAVTAAGALGIENLNVNEMSSYFILMIACSFIIFCNSKKYISKVVIVASDVVVVVAQIGAASRRGFIVAIMLIFTGILFGIIPFFSENYSKKRFVYIALALTIVCMGAILLRDYVFDSTILGARLSGYFDNGDIARKRYQTYAWEQFKLHPLFGIGIGGIAHEMGAYSHSLYYELFSCTGIIGTGIMFSGLFYIGRQALHMINKCKRNGKNKYISLLLCMGLLYWLSIMISGISVVMIYDCYFYISIALLLSIIQVAKKKSINMIFDFERRN